MATHCLNLRSDSPAIFALAASCPCGVTSQSRSAKRRARRNRCNSKVVTKETLLEFWAPRLVPRTNPTLTCMRGVDTATQTDEADSLDAELGSAAPSDAFGSTRSSARMSVENSNALSLPAYLSAPPLDSTNKLSNAFIVTEYNCFFNCGFPSFPRTLLGPPGLHLPYYLPDSSASAAIISAENKQLDDAVPIESPHGSAQLLGNASYADLQCKCLWSMSLFVCRRVNFRRLSKPSLQHGLWRGTRSNCLPCKLWRETSVSMSRMSSCCEPRPETLTWQTPGELGPRLRLCPLTWPWSRIVLTIQWRCRLACRFN